MNGGNGFASLIASGGNAVRLFGGGGTDYLSASGGTNIGLFGENGDNTYVLFGSAANPFTGYLDALGTVGLDQSTTDQLQSGAEHDPVPNRRPGRPRPESARWPGRPRRPPRPRPLRPSPPASRSTSSGRSRGVVGSAAGNDIIRGNALPNSLVAGAGNATLMAGSGDATLVAGSGNTSLVGGGGRTTYAFHSPTGNATVTQTNPNNLDVIDLSALTGPATPEPVDCVRTDRYPARSRSPSPTRSCRT